MREELQTLEAESSAMSTGLKELEDEIKIL